MQTPIEKNNEERLNRLFTAAKEEPLLASMDDVTSRLDSGIPLAKKATPSKLKVVYRALMIAFLLFLSGMGVYFFASENKTVSDDKSRQENSVVTVAAGHP